MHLVIFVVGIRTAEKKKKKRVSCELCFDFVSMECSTFGRRAPSRLSRYVPPSLLTPRVE